MVIHLFELKNIHTFYKEMPLHNHNFCLIIDLCNQIEYETRGRCFESSVIESPTEGKHDESMCRRVRSASHSDAMKDV